MKLISSPAKLMKVGNSSEFLKTSNPKFIKEAEFIQSFLKEKSPKFLAELMEISPKLADENWHRNQNWTPKPTPKTSAPALFSFSGEVYRGLDAAKLTEPAVHYLQKNYRMLSGLYGLLKPSDRIMLYRLEMGRNFEFDSYKNLYSFWREKITIALNAEMKQGEPLLNLASAEYFKALDKKQLKAKIIDFEFYELKSGKPKTIVVYTKHARGLVVRYCAENQINNLEDIKNFNLENYLFDDTMSSENKFVFTR